MTTFNTGNPIGSTDARDRLDNSENMDILENSTTLNEHPDRLGVMRKTRKGMELEHDAQIAAHETEFADRILKMAFTPVGTFTTGATLTDARQTLLWEVSEGGDGHYYSWSGSFPKIVAAGSSPSTSGGVSSGAWADRSDVTLRSEINVIWRNFACIADIDGNVELGDKVFVENYYLNGNSGSLFFTVVSAATGAHDGGKYIDLPSSGLQLIQNLKTPYNPKAWGAKGDGSTNDTVSFQSLSAYVTSLGKGKVLVDAGTYIVHDQTIGTSPYYNTVGHVLSFTDCDGLVIEFAGAVLKTKDGLHYGSFDPTTGAAVGTQTSEIYAAKLSSTLNLSGCSNVTVINPDFDGNNENLIIGGGWGDSGIQADHTGIRVSDCKHVTLINPKSYYYGLDSLYITATSADFDMQVLIENGDFQYSGRQGFSWTGGNGVTAINTKFMNTGRGGLSSAPSAGMDIEDNGLGCRDGLFIGCKFSDNVGADCLVINSYDRIKFDACTFAGSGRTVWVGSVGTNRDIQFNKCRVFGNIAYAGAYAKWKDCYITDKTLSGSFAPTYRMLEPNGLTSDTTFDGCIFEATRYDLIDNIYATSGTFLRCKAYFKLDSVPVRTRVSLIRPAKVDDFEIIETFTNSDACAVAGEHAYIDTTYYEPTNTLNWKFTGANLAFGSRSGNVNYVYGSRRNAAVTDYRTYTGDNATSISIPLGIGTKMLVITKTTGNTMLRYCKAVVLVCSNSSSIVALHASTILAKTVYGLGTGDISVVQAGISSSCDSLVITSTDQSLLGEVFGVYEVDMSILQPKVLPETAFQAYTLPATAFPI